MAKTTNTKKEKETKCIIGGEILSTFGDTFIEHLLKSSAINQQAEKMCADRDYTFSDVVANNLIEVNPKTGEEIDSRYIIRLYNRETKEVFYTTSKGLCGALLRILEPFNADLMGYKVTIHVTSVELEQGRTFSCSIIGAESLEKVNSISLEAVDVAKARAIDLTDDVPIASDVPKIEDTTKVTPVTPKVDVDLVEGKTKA